MMQSLVSRNSILQTGHILKLILFLVQCDMCKKYFENDNNTEFSIYTDGAVKNFCCKTCQNIHIIATRRIVPCSWCKVKKYNFDMIKKICPTGQTLNMCSLNCLSLFQVSVNAVNAAKK